MKIWKLETQTPTHKIIRLHCEDHSDMIYVGEFEDDNALKVFFSSLDKEIDSEKNIKLLKYYGYLHLLLKK
jgi:hypothetical protein